MDSSTDRPIPPDHALDRDDWSKRRLRLDAVLLLFSGLTTYILITGRSQPVDTLAIPSLIGGIVALIGVYVFGAVWDYKSFMGSMVGLSNREER